MEIQEKDDRCEKYLAGSESLDRILSGIHFYVPDRRFLGSVSGSV